MNALINFLVLWLVSSLLLLSVEARKLISNGFFTVDLIHRDSPLSPYYNSSMTPQERLVKLTLGSVSLGHRAHMSPTYYDQKDVNNDLIPNGGDYLIKIAIGTPPVEFIAIADTGSNLIWVQCSPCRSCIPQESPLFDPTKSSTFRNISCNSQSCQSPDFRSQCHENDINNDRSCVYTTSYGDGTTTSTGFLATDTLGFALADATTSTHPSSILGCGFDQHGHNFGNQGDGIVGLGTGELSLVSQLGANINHKFSYCLAPLSSGLPSKLNFGLAVTGPEVVSTPFTNSNSLGFYSLTLDEISIGDSSIPAGQNVIIDSGTTYTFLQPNIYDAVRDTVKGAIELSPVPDPNNMLDPCYDAQPSGGEGFNPPDIVFHFKGANVVLKAPNTFITLGSITCLAMRPVDSGDMIFGNIAQVNFQVGYDLQAKQVSFAPTDCTKY